ncbi:MAG: addiction module antidote protein HigA family, partial [Segetibacter sp.]|nr:addiction module antidote protein HigA family [Segetibacter sp.]
MSTNIKSLIPAIVLHPGEILKDELDQRNIKQKDFAELIGIQPTQLNEILKGKRGINADYALLIGTALKIDPSTWLNLQLNYEFDLAKRNEKVSKRVEAISQWQMLKDYIPEEYFRKVGVIKGDPEYDITTIKKVYNITTLHDLAGTFNKMTFAKFRKSLKLTTDRINLLGWINLVNYKASALPVKKFEIKNREEIIVLLKEAFYKNKNTIPKTQEILNDFGIKCIILPHPSRCAIDGISFFNNGHPIIGLSLRFNRIDYFAFTLLHELAHVFLHLNSSNKKDHFIDLDINNE